MINEIDSNTGINRLTYAVEEDEHEYAQEYTEWVISNNTEFNAAIVGDG